MIQGRIVVGSQASGGANLPFTVSVIAGGTIEITDGYYSVSSGTPVLKSELAGAAGPVYIRIKHSSAGVFESFEISYGQEFNSPVSFDVDGTYIEYTNILLAEVTIDEESPVANSVIIQHRSGNVDLVHGFYNGSIHYAAQFIGGDVS